MADCVDDQYMLRPIDVDKGRQCFIQEPHVRTVKTKDHAYRLALPYFVFTRVDYHFRVAVSPVPIDDLDAPIYWAPFPNIGKCLGVCMKYPKAKDLELYIDQFWSSPFYNDVNWYGTQIRKKLIGRYARWEKKSAKDPDFVLGLDWVPVQLRGRHATVNDMLTFKNVKYDPYGREGYGAGPRGRGIVYDFPDLRHRTRRQQQGFFSWLLSLFR